jgi:predicted RNase H-like HicB family nuclease
LVLTATVVFSCLLSGALQGPFANASNNGKDDRHGAKEISKILFVPVRRYTELAVRTFKVIVEKHSDGYVAYPLGIRGGVVGQGASYEEALADVTSAIRFHLETFGESEIENEPEILEAFVAEARIDSGAAVPG